MHPLDFDRRIKAYSVLSWLALSSLKHSKTSIFLGHAHPDSDCRICTMEACCCSWPTQTTNDEGLTSFAYVIECMWNLCNRTHHYGYF